MSFQTCFDRSNLLMSCFFYSLLFPVYPPFDDTHQLMAINFVSIYLIIRWLLPNNNRTNDWNDELLFAHWLFSYFDEFRLCSYALHVRVCEPRGDGISSFQHLLDNVVLRVSVWIVAILACCGNTCVLIGRMFMQEMNEVITFSTIQSFQHKKLSIHDMMQSTRFTLT